MMDICDQLVMESELKENEVCFCLFIGNIFGVVYCCLSLEFWEMLFISDVIQCIIGYFVWDFSLFNFKCSFVELIYFDDLVLV